jgi:hypothetical protein
VHQRAQLEEGKHQSSQKVPTVLIGKIILKLLKRRTALSDICSSRLAAAENIQCKLSILHCRVRPARDDTQESLIRIFLFGSVRLRYMGTARASGLEKRKRNQGLLESLALWRVVITAASRGFAWVLAG